MMQYKGYVGEADIDTDAGIIHGRLVGIRPVITFEGQTVREAFQAFQESVDDYLSLCAERGEEPERPFSGKFVVRIDPELHRDVVYAARARNMTLNAFAEEALAYAVGERGHIRGNSAGVVEIMSGSRSHSSTATSAGGKGAHKAPVRRTTSSSSSAPRKPLEIAITGADAGAEGSTRKSPVEKTKTVAKAGMKRPTGGG